MKSLTKFSTPRIFSFLLGALLLFLSATACRDAQGRTVAATSIADTSAVITAALDPRVLKSPSETYLECANSIENYRVHTAAIFGDNNLDDLDYKTQCESNLGREAPPSGLFMKIRNGKSIPMGSGDLVVKNDVVVTSAHLFRFNGTDLVLPGDKVVFAVYEKDESGVCRRNNYPVSDVQMGTRDPEKSGERGDDFAVVKLEAPVKSYEPLSLPSEAEMERLIKKAKAGDIKLIASGFGAHDSIGFGRDLTLVVGRAYEVPKNVGNYYSNAPNAFLHDIDSVPGMSGGSISNVEEAPENSFMLVGNREVPKRYVRNFLGINAVVKTFNEGVRFNKVSEYNAGLFVNPKMRKMIEEAAGTGEVIQTADIPVKKEKRTN